MVEWVKEKKKQKNTHSSQMYMEHSPDHILGYKTRLKQLKNAENIPYIFSESNDMKLEINHKKKIWKNTNM